MIDEHQEELACLYACDQLLGEELTAFETAMAKDPELRELVEQLRETTAGLAIASRTLELPSDALRERVLTTANGKRRVRLNPGKVAAFFLRPQVAWGLAAACFVLAAASAISLNLARSNSAAARAEVATAEAEIKSLLQQIEAERILGAQQLAEYKQAADMAALKIARLQAANDASKGQVALLIWNPLSQQGVLEVENLPACPTGREYQLWIIDPQYADPVDGGAFPHDSTGATKVRFHPKQPISGATLFAISLERTGGVPKAEGPIVAAGAP